jgi:hypothetical protein
VQKWLEPFCDVSFTGENDPHDEAWDVLAYAAILLQQYGTESHTADQGPCALTAPREDNFSSYWNHNPRLLPNGRTQGACGDYNPNGGGVFIV